MLVVFRSLRWFVGWYFHVENHFFLKGVVFEICFQDVRFIIFGAKNWLRLRGEDLIILVDSR